MSGGVTPNYNRPAVEMSEPFFKRPILNSPYEYPGRHWKLDDRGLPTSEIVESRRVAEFISPVPATEGADGQADAAPACLGEKDLIEEEHRFTVRLWKDPPSEAKR